MNIEDKILEYKTHLDWCAETGWKEIKTSAYIDSIVKKAPLVRGFGENKTGRIYTVGNGSKKIFLRADIDALPTKNTIKHICGHSTHTASLLGAFEYAVSKEKELTQQNKQIVFIFQPAEETFPSGATEIIKTNLDLISSCIYGFGLHVAPDYPRGTIALFDGVINAAGDYFEIEVTGTSTHVKSTPKGIDAIEGASYVISMFKNFQKELPNFGTETVFNINTVKGGTAANRVADRVFMNGDIRWFNKEDNLKMKTFFKNLPDELKKKYKGNVKLTYFDGYPPLNNDVNITTQIASYITKNTNLRLADKKIRSLGTEDFSFYSEKIPTLYAKIGVKSAHELHDDSFDVEPDGVLLAYDYWQTIIDWFTSVTV